MITGWFDYGHPYLTGVIQIVEYDIEGSIDFMVDTGATFTCIHPKDGTILGLPYDRLVAKVCVNTGGGTVERWTVSAVVSFRDDDHLPVYRYEIPVLVAPSGEVSNDLPSVLGQDVLGHWTMVHDRPSGKLEFEVHSADSTDVDDD